MDANTVRDTGETSDAYSRALAERQRAAEARRVREEEERAAHARARAEEDRLTRGFAMWPGGPSFPLAVHSVPSVADSAAAAAPSSADAPAAAAAPAGSAAASAGARDGWVRSSETGGWVPCATPRTEAYRVPPSATSLPLWLFDELDVPFALRHCSSPDFESGCRLLGTLFEQYYARSSLQLDVRMWGDVVRAARRVTPTASPLAYASQPAASALLEKAARKIRATERRCRFLRENTRVHEERIAVAEAELERLRSLGEFAQPAFGDSESFFDCIPDEILMEIFLFLEPRFFGNAALLLERRFPSANRRRVGTLGAPDSYKSVFVALYTRTKTEGTSGLRRCGTCDCFYWSGAPRPMSCNHRGGLVAPSAVLESILTRRVKPGRADER